MAMVADEYLVGVGNAYYYDTNDNLIFSSKTQIENSIAASTGNTEIRSGMGNQLNYVYYHTSKMEITLKEAQFSLPVISAAFGSSITTGNNVWVIEGVTLGSGGAGSVVGIPLISPDATVAEGEVFDQFGNATKVTFTGSNFTLVGGTSGQSVTVRYYGLSSASQQVVIPANIVPSIGRLVIDATMASSSVGTGVLGRVSIEIPRFQMDGSHTFDLKSSGVYENDVKGMALRYYDNAYGDYCYAKVTKIVNGAHWYDNVNFLTVADDTVALSSTNSTYQLVVWAVPSVGNAFVAPTADLTFTSSTTATATVNSSGLISRVASGTTNISIEITAKPSVAMQVDVNAT